MRSLVIAVQLRYYLSRLIFWLLKEAITSTVKVVVRCLVNYILF